MLDAPFTIDALFLGKGAARDFVLAIDRHYPGRMLRSDVGALILAIDALDLTAPTPCEAAICNGIQYGVRVRYKRMRHMSDAPHPEHGWGRSDAIEASVLREPVIYGLIAAIKKGS